MASCELFFNFNKYPVIQIFYFNRLAVNNFHNEASKVQLDLAGDSAETLRKGIQMKKWDRKKKKMVAVMVCLIFYSSDYFNPKNLG